MQPSRRGLGPFTGGQLTVLIVAALLAVSLPVGAVAAGQAARMAISGADGKTVAVVDGGRLRVQTQPAGTTTSRVAPLRDAVNPDTVSVSSDLCTPIATAPAKRALVVTRIHVNAYAVPSPPGVSKGLFLFRGGCADQFESVNPGQVGVTVLDYEPGLTVPAGRKLSAFVLGNVATDVTVSGYLVAKTEVPGTPITVSRHAPGSRNGQRVGR